MRLHQPASDQARIVRELTTVIADPMNSHRSVVHDTPLRQIDTRIMQTPLWLRLSLMSRHKARRPRHLEIAAVANKLAAMPRPSQDHALAERRQISATEFDCGSIKNSEARAYRDKFRKL